MQSFPSIRSHAACHVGPRPSACLSIKDNVLRPSQKKCDRCKPGSLAPGGRTTACDPHALGEDQASIFETVALSAQKSLSALYRGFLVGGRSFHAGSELLGGDQCGEQRGPDLQHSTTFMLQRYHLMTLRPSTSDSVLVKQCFTSCWWRLNVRNSINKRSAALHKKRKES